MTRTWMLATTSLVLSFVFAAPAAAQEPVFRSLPVFETEAGPIPPPANVEVGDIDGDGDNDVVMAIHLGIHDDVMTLLQDEHGDLAEGPLALVGRQIRRIVLADFTEDGVLDLAVALDGTFEKVIVYPGNGDATFGAQLVVDVAAGPWDLDVADLDGDGHLDLVTPASEDGVVSVLLGLGDGTFAPAVDFAVGTTPRAAALGDVDGDGALDVLTANLDSDDVSLLLGDGLGGFAPGTGFATTFARPYDVQLGDLDADGNLDAVVGAEIHETVEWRLGAGDGSFGAPATRVLEGNTRQVVVADLDEDGDDDLAVRTPNQELGELRVMLSHGDGTLDDVAYGAFGGNHILTAADVNGDGDLDLVTGSHSTNGSFAVVLEGDGKGRFGPLYSYVADGAGGDVRFADMTGDGIDDMVMLERAEDLLRVVEGVGNATFGRAMTTSVSDRPAYLDLADFDGDGNVDALVGTTGLPASDHVLVLHGDGAGGFGPPTVLALTADMSFVIAADVDADGHPDALSLDQSHVWVFRNDQAGGFLPPETYLTNTECGSGDMAYRDVTGDGLGDVIVLSTCFADEPDPVQVFPGLGDGTFGPVVESFTSIVIDESMALGDLDEDGLPDLVVATDDESLGILLNLGGGAFGPTTVVPTTDWPRGLALDDFDRDGHVDLAVGVHFGTFLPFGNQAAVLLYPGLGDGTFGPFQEFFVKGRMHRLLLRDLDGDGVNDLAVNGYFRDWVHLLVNRRGPWEPLGHALAGQQGLPRFVASGTPVAGHTVRMTLSDYREASQVSFYVGLSAIFAPFKGGVFVPSPDVLFTPLFTDATGDVSFAFPWPAGLEGISLWMQFWGPDADGPLGFAASNAVRVDVP